MKLQLLLTGNELMSGHTIDANSATIAQQLADAGFTISRKVTIGDEFEQLVTELSQLSAGSDVLMVNGGLGPTSDDLTAEALAVTTGQTLQENASALRHLQSWCEKRKVELNQANLKQAMLPGNAQVIPNANGSAVGFYLDYQDCLIICTPGVPGELAPMLEQSIVPLLSQRFAGHKPGHTLRFQTFGLGESTLQQMINSQYSDWPQEVTLGFRAGSPLLEVKLHIQHLQHRDIQQQCYERLRLLAGDYIVGENSTSLARAVVDLLHTRAQTITTAESCTGGQVAAAITAIPGASCVFEAGFVTYSDSMKEQLLGVDNTTLQEHGAVSEAVVTQMAQGAIARSHADFAIAVSGIAGPDGGTDDKPVGTVWMAWGTQASLKTRRLHVNASRHGFQRMVTATTLDLIRRELLSIESTPRYFK